VTLAAVPGSFVAKSFSEGSHACLDEDAVALQGRVDTGGWAVLPPPIITNELGGADSFKPEA
jgi:hypothetical protein